MKTPLKQLTVHFNSDLLGTLILGSDRVCRFQYSDWWLQNGFSISPLVLPLRNELFVARAKPFDGLFGVFADSMPDGWGNLLLDRFLMAKGYDITQLDVLDRLCYVGANGMGAIRYEPDWSFDPDYGQAIGSIAQKVADILDAKYDLPTLTDLLKQTGSSGGARPKVILRLDGSDWLVKFRGSSDPENVGQLEYQFSVFARECGIEMPRTQLLHHSYFATELFDRKVAIRTHMHSAAGLLYASHRYASLDYTHLAQLTLKLTGSKTELERLMRLMVFNVLIGNMDDHAKNFSFLCENGVWRLSPGYDLLPSKGFGGEHATAIAGVGRPGRKQLVQLAEGAGIQKKWMNALIDELLEKGEKSDLGSLLVRIK